jgi:hypothetical protein
MAAHRKSCWFDVRYKGTAPMSFDGVRRAKAALFQWVKAPPGELLQPEAPGATMEATKWLKPLGKACHEIR